MKKYLLILTILVVFSSCVFADWVRPLGECSCISNSTSGNGTSYIFNPPYLYNVSETVYFNVTPLNSLYYPLASNPSGYLTSELDPVWTADKSNYYTKVEVNQTIDDKLASTTIFDVNYSIVNGTKTAGNISSAYNQKDNNILNITELSGINSLEVNFTFNLTKYNVSTFNQIFIREYYQGSLAHNIQLQLWDFSSSSWEDGYFTFQGQSQFITSEVTVTDPQDHIQNGMVYLRLVHIENGISSHKLSIDWLVLSKGLTSFSSQDDDSMYLDLSGNRQLNSSLIIRHPTSQETMLNISRGLYMKFVRNSSSMTTPDKTGSVLLFTSDSLISGCEINMTQSGTERYSFCGSTWNAVGVSTFNIGSLSPTGSYWKFNHYYPQFVINVFNASFIPAVSEQAVSTGSIAEYYTQTKYERANGNLTFIPVNSFVVQKISSFTNPSLVIVQNTSQTGNSLSVVNGSSGIVFASINNVGKIMGQGLVIGNVSSSYPLYVNSNYSGISAYLEGNISTSGVITRTDVFTSASTATSQIKNSSEYLTKSGNINHTAFGYSAVSYDKQIIIGYTKKNFTDLVCEYKDENTTICKNMNIPIDVPIYATIKEEGVDLGKEVALLKQALYEQIQKNNDLETRINKLEASMIIK